jgi:heptosyltransferase II
LDGACLKLKASAVSGKQLTGHGGPKYLPAVHDSPSVPNVLAVRFSSIGDVLLTTPLLRAIRHRHPASQLSVVTKAAYAPLLSDNPYLNRVIAWDPERGIVGLAVALRVGRYTHLLDLHESVRTLALRALVPGNWSGYPKHRIARTLLIHAKHNWYRDSKPVAERYFSAARQLDVRPDGGPPDFFLGEAARTDVDAWLDSVKVGQDRDIVAVAPGAAHATKRWPASHWHTLIERLVCQNYDVIAVGGPTDQALAETLSTHRSGRVASAAGRFGLQGTGALLKRSAALVSGDTGVMHMATAVGTPVVALFGPTVREFGFFPYTPAAQVVELELPCRPCSSQGSAQCPLRHHRCLVEVGPDLVLSALSRCLS